MCETKAPGDIVQKAKPFVVTIPHPNTAQGADGQWIYDVHVYPKNDRIGVSKTIEDQKANGYSVGSKVRFPVYPDVLRLDPASHYKYFQVRDTLDSRLKNVTATVFMTSDNGTSLEPSDYVVAVDGQTVTVNVHCLRPGQAQGCCCLVPRRLVIVPRRLL